MSIFTVKQEINKDNLQKFGYVLSSLLLLFFILFYPLILKKGPYLFPIIVSITFFILSFIYPYFFKPIYVIFAIIGNVLGSVNQFILLILIFYIIITPVNFFLWILRFDPLKRNFNKKLKTYRVIDDHIINMEDPF